MEPSDFNWSLKKEGNWELESSIYSEYFDKAFKLLEKRGLYISELIARFPFRTQNIAVDDKSNILFILSCFVLECLDVALQLYYSLIDLFAHRSLCCFPLPARLIFELWGAVHYSLKMVDKFLESNDIDSVREKMLRLTLGARSPVKLPWTDDYTDIRSINVMDFVRTLEEFNGKAMDTYSFLCESCHPSRLRFMILRLEAWNNERDCEEADKIIKRTLEIVENSLDGITLDVIKILEIRSTYSEGNS